jgi:hypothetical protein
LFDSLYSSFLSLSAAAVKKWQTSFQVSDLDFMRISN